MLRLISDDDEQVAPSQFRSQCPLIDLLSSVSNRLYVNYFAVNLISSNRVELQFSVFHKHPALITVLFYNHKGNTYVSVTRVQTTYCAALQSYNQGKMIAKEWITSFELPQIAISVAAPNGQLISSAFQQLEFTHVAIGNSEITITARTTNLDRCRSVVIMVDICHPLPKFYCYDTGD